MSDYLCYPASLLSAMDHSTDPCQDFFQYACGTWKKNHVIPEDRSSISTFEVMADQLQVILKGVLEESINADDNEATTKAKTFYNTCMNIPQIRKIGDVPLRNVLSSLGGWPVTDSNWEPPSFSIEILLGRLRGDFNEGVLIEQWVGPDDKNSSVNIIQPTAVQDKMTILALLSIERERTATLDITELVNKLVHVKARKREF